MNLGTISKVVGFTGRFKNRLPGSTLSLQWTHYPIVQYLRPHGSTFSVLHYMFVHWSRNSLCISFYAPVSNWFIQSVFYHLPTPVYKVHPRSSTQSSFQRDNNQPQGTTVCLCVKRRFGATPQRELPAIEDCHQKGWHITHRVWKVPTNVPNCVPNVPTCVPNVPTRVPNVPNRVPNVPNQVPNVLDVPSVANVASVPNRTPNVPN